MSSGIFFMKVLVSSTQLLKRFLVFIHVSSYEISVFPHAIYKNNLCSFLILSKIQCSYKNTLENSQGIKTPLMLSNRSNFKKIELYISFIKDPYLFFTYFKRKLHIFSGCLLSTHSIFKVSLAKTIVFSHDSWRPQRLLTDVE